MGFARQLCGAACFSALIVSVAHAQEDNVPSEGDVEVPSEDEVGVLQRVVVTARRREEALSDVSVAVQAFDAQAIEDRSIDSEDDLQFAVPGLTVRTTSQNLVTFSIRGQSVDAFTGSSPAVLAYANEIQANVPGFSNYFDLASVEVLKGPQGTLFGRNTTGGAVLYRSAMPGDEYSGYLRAKAGNFNERGLQGAVDVPVSDIIGIRLAANYLKRDGFVENLFDGTRQGEIDNFNGRATLVFEPTSALENTTILEAGENSGRPVANQLFSIALPGETNNGNVLNSTAALLYGPTLDLLAGPGAWQAFLDANPRVNPNGVIGAVNFERRSGPWKTRTSAEMYFDSNYFYGANITEFEVTPNLQIKNIFGYTRSEYDVSTDLLGSEFAIYNFVDTAIGRDGNFNDSDVMSEELQLLGEYGDLEFILGGFWSEQEIRYRAFNSFFDLSPVIPRVNSSQGFNTENETVAIFGQGALDLAGIGMDGFSLTIGYRHTWEDNYIESPPELVDQPTLTFATADPQSISFDDPSWQVGLDYKPNANWLLYVMHRRSWRNGGFNGFVNRVTATAEDGGNLFLPETTHDIEAGAKFAGAFYGRPAQLNVAVYNQWVEDVQRVIYFIPPGAAAVSVPTINIPEAEITGVEIDGQSNVANGLTIGGSLAYTDARYTDATASVFGTLRTYGPYADAPEWAGNIFFEASPPVPSSVGKVTFRADMYAQSEFYFSNLDDTVSPGTRIDPYQLLNLKLDWDVADTNLRLSLYGKNVFEEEYYTGGIGLLDAFGANSAIPGAARMYGVEATYKW